MVKKLAIACLGTLILSTSAMATSKNHTVKVIESKTAGAYTYLNVEENGNKYWVAIQSSPVKVGDTVNITESVWMNNFKSNALDKTFDKIMFAQVENSQQTDIHAVHGDMIKKNQNKNLM